VTGVSGCEVLAVAEVNLLGKFAQHVEGHYGCWGESCWGRKRAAFVNVNKLIINN